MSRELKSLVDIRSDSPPRGARNYLNLRCKKRRSAFQAILIASDPYRNEISGFARARIFQRGPILGYFVYFSHALRGWALLIKMTL